MATLDAQALLVVNVIGLGWPMRNREAVNGIADAFRKRDMRGENAFEQRRLQVIE